MLRCLADLMVRVYVEDWHSSRLLRWWGDVFGLMHISSEQLAFSLYYKGCGHCDMLRLNYTIVLDSCCNKMAVFLPYIY
jgi:hypothetical protein